MEYIKTNILFTYILFIALISFGTCRAQAIQNLLYKDHTDDSYRMIKEGKNLKLQCTDNEVIYKGRYSFTPDHLSIIVNSDTILISNIEKLWIRTSARIGGGTTLMLLYGGAMGFAAAKGPGEAIVTCFLGSPILCAGMSLVIFRKRFDIDDTHSLSYKEYKE